MLKQPSYWETEDRIPLMVMNKGFVAKDKLEEAFERASKWVAMFQPALEVEKIEFDPELEPTRIIVKDVERTFTGEEFRERLTRTLSLLDKEFKDYHQGMSFLVSFLELFLDDDSIVAIARHLNKNVIEGYWRHEAAAFVRDAYVLDHLLKSMNAPIHAHLAKNHIMPGTYPQKWFVALCVHVLPFEALFAFYDRFFSRGIKYLFQFALGFFDVLGPRILQSDNAVNIFGFLRLDRTVVSFDDSTYMEIIHASDKIDLSSLDDPSHENYLPSLRERMYKTHLGTRFEAISAQNAQKEQEDDEDLDWDEDAEAEPGTECEVCNNMAPDFWCFDCKLFVCGMCNNKSRPPHNKAHKMVSASSAPPEAFEKKASDLASNDDDDGDVKDLAEKVSEL